MIKIVKGKKIPPREFGASHTGATRVYPFDKMAKGDAFAVNPDYANNVYVALRYYNTTNKKKIRLVSRKIDNKKWFWKA